MVFQVLCTVATDDDGDGGADVGDDGGRSKIYSSVATLKFNIKFNGKPLTLMIATESCSGAFVALDDCGNERSTMYVCCTYFNKRLQRTLKY